MNKTNIFESDSISLRYVFPQEMARLLDQMGFTVVDQFGAWDKEALNENSSEMIYVCQKRGKEDEVK